ncbi:MAG: 4-(cytidine 5'-diphospho)-2-C-methyl-D-erythritol kinase [Hydrogenoanaerobacterium sp.]
MTEGEYLSEITLKAPAKLNLTLDVTGRRGDGYHLLEMVMQAVELHDTITVAEAQGEKINITCKSPKVPCDENNLCYKAARHFFENVGVKARGLNINIEKNIPTEAGMAGGSSDAAAVLIALNELCCTGLTVQRLCQIGVSVGADVPFCIVGGTALCVGIGEIITPLAPLCNCNIVVAKPKIGMKTPHCFALYDSAVITKRPNAQAVKAAIAKADLQAVAQNLCNVLEEAAAISEVQKLKAVLLHDGALGALMTGSGTAVFGIFDDAEKAAACAQGLKAVCDEVFVTTPIARGVHK